MTNGCTAFFTDYDTASFCAIMGIGMGVSGYIMKYDGFKVTYSLQKTQKRLLINMIATLFCTPTECLVPFFYEIKNRVKEHNGKIFSCLTIF